MNISARARSCLTGAGYLDSDELRDLSDDALLPDIGNDIEQKKKNLKMSFKVE